MTQPLREDFPIYDFPSEKVIDGPWPPAATPAAVLANPDALQEPKRPGRPKGAKSKSKKKRAKKAKAPAAEVPATVPETAPIQSQRVAAGGEGAVARLRRVSADVWLIVAACVAALALGASLAYMIIR